MGPTKRGLGGTLTQVYFVIGYMSTSALGYFVPDWRGFTIAMAIWSGFTALTIPFYPESPQFLYARNRHDAGKKVLKEFATKTKSDLSDKFFEKFEKQLSKEMVTEDTKEKFTIVDLFRFRGMSLISINLCVAFLVWETDS